MSTHDQQTATDPYEDSQTGGEPARLMTEHAAPVETAEPPSASTQEPPAPRRPIREAADAHLRDRATGESADLGTGAESLSGETSRAGTHSVAAPGPASADSAASTSQQLFAGDELADLRARWATVQAAFVDDPKETVQKADGLVADLVEQLTTGFGRARSRLEDQWARGEEATTEDLRMTLMHYREFFDRLLEV